MVSAGDRRACAPLSAMMFGAVPTESLLAIVFPQTAARDCDAVS
jgi:hypothetical protein